MSTPRRRRGHDPLSPHPHRDAGHRARDRRGARRGHPHRVSSRRRRRCCATRTARVRAMVVQRMRLGEPDASGRRVPVPIEGDSVRAADRRPSSPRSARSPTWRRSAAERQGSWLSRLMPGDTPTSQGMWSGGDNMRPRPGDDLDRAGPEGRRVDSRRVARNRSPDPRERAHHRPREIKMDFYETKPRAERTVLHARGAAGPAEGGDRPRGHVRGRARRGDTLLLVRPVLRLRKCWMYCQNSCFMKVTPPIAATTTR